MPKKPFPGPAWQNRVDFAGKKGYDWHEVMDVRSLDNRIEKFCRKHPGFGLRNLMIFIVIGQVIVYLFTLMDRTGTLVSYLYFNPRLFLHGQVWRLVTFVLVPESSSPFFFAVALYFYYFIGSNLERAWGTPRFNIYYMGGMLLTALYSILYYAVTRRALWVTSNYLNLSLFFAFATMWPDQRVLLFFFIPIKIKWLAWVDAALFVLSVVTYIGQGSIGMALVPVVAMLTYLVFCGQWLFDFFRPSTVRRKTAQKARTIQFKQAARKVQQEQKAQGYTRKCEVCGRTDRDYPDLEFRYCSRCAGYHCFCIDHINNHIHFTE